MSNTFVASATKRVLVCFTGALTAPPLVTVLLPQHQVPSAATPHVVIRPEPTNVNVGPLTRVGSGRQGLANPFARHVLSPTDRAPSWPVRSSPKQYASPR